MAQPLVSVIIPCYNAQKFVEKAVRSIMEQTYTNLEILCCDDCSTDKTLIILQKLSQEDSRVKVIKNEQNLKIVQTLNKLVYLSSGKYIARMDADDISLPNRIEKQVEFMEKNVDVGICGCNIFYIDEKGKKIRKSNFPKTDKSIQNLKFFRTPFCHPTIMFNSDLRKYFYYKDEYLYAEDYGLWLELLDKFKGVNLKKCYFYYRLHNEQVTYKHNSEQINSLKKIYKKDLSSFLNKNEMNIFCFFIVCRKVKSLKELLKIFIKIKKGKGLVLTFTQKLFLFFNALYCWLRK